jgi:hypothetical protein
MYSVTRQDSFLPSIAGLPQPAAALVAGDGFWQHLCKTSSCIMSDASPLVDEISLASILVRAPGACVR